MINHRVHWTHIRAGPHLIPSNLSRPQAEWCGPCKKIAPELEALHQAQLRRERPRVLFYKVDVDQAREIAAEAGVKSMPTLHFFRNGKHVAEIVGADMAAIREIVGKATQNAVMRALRSEILAVAAVGLYLIIPWGKVLEA